MEALQVAEASKDEIGLKRILVLAKDIVAGATRAKAEAEPAPRDAKADLEMTHVPSGGASAESAKAINDAFGRGEIPFTPRVAEARKSLGYS